MHLTKQTNYAVRMLMYCASSEGLSQISTIARFYDLSEQFLSKIAQTLTKAGLLESVRGRNGGVHLGKPAHDIRLGDIIRATEDNFALAECFEEGETKCPLVASCGLNQALGRALNAFFVVLDEYTLSDLVNNESNLQVLMQLEAAKREPFDANQLVTKSH